MFIRYARTFDALGKLQGSTVLDIGCGSGPYVVEAFKHGAGRVTAIDPAPNMLVVVRQRLDQIGVNGNRCELVEGMFPGVLVEPHDFAIVTAVMDYVEDARTFLSALRSLVKRLALVSFLSEHWFRSPFRKLRYRLRRCPVYFYDDAGIRKLCMEAGFTDIRTQKIPGAGMDFHVCLRP